MPARLHRLACGLTLMLAAPLARTAQAQARFRLPGADRYGEPAPAQLPTGDLVLDNALARAIVAGVKSYGLVHEAPLREPLLDRVATELLRQTVLDPAGVHAAARHHGVFYHHVVGLGFEI